MVRGARGAARPATVGAPQVLVLHRGTAVRPRLAAARRHHAPDSANVGASDRIVGCPTSRDACMDVGAMGNGRRTAVDRPPLFDRGIEDRTRRVVDGSAERDRVVRTALLARPGLLAPDVAADLAVPR